MRSKELKLFFIDIIIIPTVKRAQFKNEQGAVMLQIYLNMLWWYGTPVDIKVDKSTL